MVCILKLVTIEYDGCIKFVFLRKKIDSKSFIKHLNYIDEINNTWIYDSKDKEHKLTVLCNTYYSIGLFFAIPSLCYVLCKK